MIKAVIFDCFGVLTTDGWLAFRGKYLVKGTDAYEQAHGLNVRHDRGLISYDDFIGGIAALAEVDFDTAKKVVEQHATNEALYAYIRDKVKPDYKIGLLSNAGANWLDDLFEPWQVALFDQTTLSYEIGFAKPAHEAYEQAALQLGVLPEECLFTDDQPRFVEAAIGVGMKGLVFTDTDTFIKEFEEIMT